MRPAWRIASPPNRTMHRHVLLSAALTVAASSALFAPSLSAQDHKELGRMWTYEHAPLDFLESEYGFRPTQEWLDHLRLSSLRYGGGCSASFVSPRGLILTNHHCARENVVTVSPPGQDWLTNGWQASSLDEEVKVPELTVQQLVATEDVTAKMNEGLTDEMSEEEISEMLAQNEEAILEAAKAASTEFEYEVKSLYQGGNYQLYTYKIYDDIRLVAVPHYQIAKFGGDPDNFTFPRFSLDFAVLRAWENDAPANTEAHYLEWRTEGPGDGETVFVSGNPGSTGRLKTMSQIEYLRDVEHPLIVERIIPQRLADLESRMANASADEMPALRDEKAGLENARKAYTGYWDGLKNEAVVDIKRQAEEAVREAVDADPELQEKYGDVWDRMATVQDLKQNASSMQERRDAFAREAALEKMVGEAFFAVYGYSIPPDATFSLRLSDGVVKGYEMNGTIAPHFTSLYGLYARFTEFGGKVPFDLPQEWIDAESKLDMKTPFCHVSTCDIIGGNSGSPIVDAQGRLVGLVFDGNIESLGNNFIFTDDVPRTVSVHPAIIIEALRKVYDSGAIADELEGTGTGY